MAAVRLSELVKSACIRFSADYGPDPEILWISSDTRNIKPGTLFVCMPSKSRDTHDLIGEAAAAGAVACVVFKAEAVSVAQSLGLGVIGLTHEGQAYNFALGRICRAFFEESVSSLQIVGVTGTNGKTTTCWMVRNALIELGVTAAYLGTLGFQSTGEIRTLENTTPFPVELWQLLAEAGEAGCEVVVMEASSHALYQRRLAGVSFDVGVFTNLTQDHLDFHGSMQSYSESKKLLFTEYAAASNSDFVGCINVGDETGASWIEDMACPIFSYGSPGAMLETVSNEVKVDSLTLTTSSGDSAQLRFGGDYNVANATSALSALMALGYDVAESLGALSQVPPVTGRFEPIVNDHGIGVIVDYAHTPDALENLLRSVRGVASGRIITVFGCGGDRDRTKRPLMAASVSSLSDVSIVTSDNPRTEDPENIIDEIVPGIADGSDWKRVTDRREAIETAISVAEVGDVVVIAGKGHEDYQIIGREKIHMSDQEMARDALSKRSSFA